MKKALFIVCFSLIGIHIFAQTWIVDGAELGENNFDLEYTIITQAQFTRILKASEQTSVAVIMQYRDNIQMINTKVKSGNRPQINGYFYILGRMLPKTKEAKEFSNFIVNILMYGNTETGAMAIMFLNELMKDSISLKYEQGEYTRKFNELIDIIDTKSSTNSISNNEGDQSLYRVLDLLAIQRAQYWEGRIDGYMSVLHTLANIMGHFENTPADERRGNFEKMIGAVFEEQPDFVQMFTVWKPNAIDGMDARNVGRISSTNTGQFIYTLGKENGQTLAITVIPSAILEIMTHINSPNAHRDNVAHPSALTISGKKIYAVRIFVPVTNVRTKEVVGVVGCQLDISIIQHSVEYTIKIIDGVAMMSIYSSNGFIMASYVPDRIGRMFIDTEKQYGTYLDQAFEKVKKGETFTCFSYAPSLKTNMFFTIFPFRIGNSDTTWSIMIGVTEAYLKRKSGY